MPVAGVGGVEVGGGTPGRVVTVLASTAPVVLPSRVLRVAGGQREVSVRVTASSPVLLPASVSRRRVLRDPPQLR